LYSKCCSGLKKLKKITESVFIINFVWTGGRYKFIELNATIGIALVVEKFNTGAQNNKKRRRIFLIFFLLFSKKMLMTSRCEKKKRLKKNGNDLKSEVLLKNKAHLFEEFNFFLQFLFYRINSRLYFALFSKTVLSFRVNKNICI
jgi:hypothetical protein